ncbi:hypothetical protein Pla52o_38990 [Novipirellula galeiformis]|uniref:Uncharacterized protein n=1 Tax=Novipirellula galeiformis TaxID=2528004 RepID=A0A5C6CC95_9BACT|nr:hypothetical protein Pla52o_38990 [Novipirellula galeiformis]
MKQGSHSTALLFSFRISNCRISAERFGPDRLDALAHRCDTETGEPKRAGVVVEIVVVEIVMAEAKRLFEHRVSVSRTDAVGNRDRSVSAERTVLTAAGAIRVDGSIAAPRSPLRVTPLQVSPLRSRDGELWLGRPADGIRPAQTLRDITGYPPLLRRQRPRCPPGPQTPRQTPPELASNGASDAQSLACQRPNQAALDDGTSFAKQQIWFLLPLSLLRLCTKWDASPDKPRSNGGPEHLFQRKP